MGNARHPVVMEPFCILPVVVDKEPTHVTKLHVKVGKSRPTDSTDDSFLAVTLYHRYGRCYPWGICIKGTWDRSEEKVALFFKPSPGVGRGSPHLVPVPSVSSSPACAP